MRYLNLAFYIFTPLENPEATADQIKACLSPLGVKGSFIVAKEGMNGFLAGEIDAARESVNALRALPGFASLQAKESFSDTVPFKRLIIKIKPEIVTFKQGEDHSPLHRKTGRVEPEQLASWYENNEDFVILDTRNDFEYHLGAFEKAVNLNIRHFVDFAEAVKRLPEDWKKKKVVTYCTGGIRCEKAAPYLASLGFQDVYQLEGGILNYFEKKGGAHWNGECFVFDHRSTLTPDLKPTERKLCYICQIPVSEGSHFCEAHKS